MRYKVPVTWTTYAEVEIEAPTLEDAIDEVEAPEFPLPSNGSYLEDSFRVCEEVYDNYPEETP